MGEGRMIKHVEAFRKTVGRNDIVRQTSKGEM